ncbi:MAG: DUF4331 family protein [Myxococcales bacterium]|nr:DUF4331 family protein [Myxococcales bacterium]
MDVLGRSGPVLRRRRPSFLLALATLGMLSPPRAEVRGSDHLDAPLTQANAVADLGDLYAWHTPGGTIVVVLTYSALLPPASPSVYDADALYTICIDNTGNQAEAADYLGNDNDNLCDIPIMVRMGQNMAGDWGVQVENLPGSAGTFSGPVEQILDGGGGTQAMVGQFDDPFFFDFDAYVATLANLVDAADPTDVAFNPGAPVDSFAGTNTMAIVLEFDAAAASAGNDFLQIWATAGTL